MSPGCRRKTYITKNRKKLKGLEDDMNDPDQDTREVLGKIEELEEAAEEIRSKQRSLAKNSSARLAHKICCGLDYLIARYDEVMVDGSKVRRRNIEYLSMDNILRDTWQMKI